MRIGIFGGSFNPIHQGHLKLARYAMNELNLNKVFFVPSCQTPLKSAKELLPIHVRVSLLKEAIRKEPAFALSLCEIQRKGLSFTVDTLEYFRKKFPKNTVLYFLCGGDAPKNFKKWKEANRLTKLARFVVMTRPGYSVRSLPKGMMYLPMEPVPVSSTLIRGRMERKQSLKGLVPKRLEARMLSIRIKK